jgi:anti-sigma regulatory factor (Ser/Thr protein kinase)
MPADVVADALLVVSELVTNAVRHGQDDVELVLERLPVGIRISVRDGGEAMPVAPDRPPDLDGTSGRGLLIVAATASKWGVYRHDEEPGKTVWAELRNGANGTSHT